MHTYFDIEKFIAKWISRRHWVANRSINCSWGIESHAGQQRNNQLPTGNCRLPSCNNPNLQLPAVGCCLGLKTVSRQFCRRPRTKWVFSKYPYEGHLSCLRGLVTIKEMDKGFKYVIIIIKINILLTNCFPLKYKEYSSLIPDYVI